LSGIKKQLISLSFLFSQIRWMLHASILNSNFLNFSESFYFKHFKINSYQYHLGQENKQSPLIKTSKSKKDKQEQVNYLILKKYWRISELEK